MWLLILLLISLIILLFSSRIKRIIALKRWRCALDLESHSKVFHKLYAKVDGFALSRKAREKSDAMEYLYGEIIFEPFIALLSNCKPDSSTIFYDLGSGTGKAVLACSMVFNIKKSCGIELFSPLYETAILQQKRLKKIPNYQHKAEHIHFILGDFMAAELDEATLIFINSTAFFGDIWKAISKHLEQIKPNSLVISTSKPLISQQFIILDKKEIAMSWGYVTAFIQRRKANSEKN